MASRRFVLLLLPLLSWRSLPCMGLPVSPLDLNTMLQFKALYVKKHPELNTWKPAADCSTWQRVTCDYNRVSGLYFQDVGLGGPFPAIISKLSGLRLLYFDGNSFTGAFPTVLSVLKSLQVIRLSGNSLVGTLPEGYSALSNLYKFHAAGIPKLTGNVPASWGTAFNLQEFYLAGSGLSGPVPTVICNWSNLQYLKIGGIPWKGSIPSCFSRNTQLRELYMDNCNTLTGPLPVLDGLHSIQRIFLNGNHLSGPIPSEWGNLVTLNAVFLSGNLITGPLPVTMGQLTALTSWTMEFNRIDGQIPSTIGNMKSVQRILLDNNRLSGKIPATIGNLKLLTILLLEGNLLTGRIPPEIPAGCTSLIQFNVESNLLSGVPPSGWASHQVGGPAGQVNFRSNILSGSPKFTYSNGASFCPPYAPNSYVHSSLAFNCFQPKASTGCKDNDVELTQHQLSVSYCQGYCGANSAVGACAGHGYCDLSKKCVCDRGFVQSGNGTTCVKGRRKHRKEKQDSHKKKQVPPKKK